jgi:hypothetical protein
LGRGDYFQLEFDKATKRGDGAPKPPGVSAKSAYRLGNTPFESWAKESYEIATKIAYRNGGRLGIPKGGAKECRDVQAAPVLPVGDVVSVSRIADRRMILAGYRLADLLTRISQNFY